MNVYIYMCVCVCVYVCIIRLSEILTLYRRRMEIIGITVERTRGENGERDRSVGVVLGSGLDIQGIVDGVQKICIL
jgi:hypothetical protein